jgi:multidrug efflux pump subunit AcrA (membrane-fusion protein)
MLAAFLAWAAWFEVTEVSTGTGKVIPSSREQAIQSFEGGIVAQMSVAEGDLVERGQVLARSTRPNRFQRWRKRSQVPCRQGQAACRQK